ncbi:class I SAM-dependent methyltransferase [Frigidibacter sp.]|uniref:class I SAM-dependent methyltransferase n=1 Tax=Frigidibacter sp. TaxID=2586418 RepID=UPI0027330825|nr:class I SAM-dependent methyltransferase [Frigidibacter sp.]MDP3339989.1 class I SAM-dependent methyltransferase [Frigidibacter sp.]
MIGSIGRMFGGGEARRKRNEARRDLRAGVTDRDRVEFGRATGPHYVGVLHEIHATHVFDWYLEVGCRTGRSFAPICSPTVAVDPFFRLAEGVMGPKRELHLFQQTSDEFFASAAPARLGARFGFAFLDGMHLFEYLLRDLIGTERCLAPGGVIALHDCYPFGRAMTTREVSAAPAGAWTGDVWKLLPILTEHRPDLRVTVLDCAPTGLVMIEGGDPANRVLSDAYDAILARWHDVTIEEYSIARFRDDFPLVAPASFTGRDPSPFAAARSATEHLGGMPEWVSP